ncbi:hypothetical protein PENSPDRAFT_684842 [Peniophora sp. CONT]|nr:hypothetical protein PENSPDRAFT_684842 [Peniophora sp. CONT]
MRRDDEAERRGWLPIEIWAKIVDEHVPPVRRGTITSVAPKEDEDTFDPYVLSNTSCPDFEGQLIRPELAGVNRQLHAFLDGAYLALQECLVVTNENARRLRLRLERVSSAARTPSTQHVSFILRLSPGAGEALNDFAGILRLVRGITVLSFGTVMDPGVDWSRMDVGALDASISRFSESFRLRSSELLRVRFLEGASFLFADHILGERQQLIEGCTALQVLSFHRRFHDLEINVILGVRDTYVTVLQPTSTHPLSHVVIDSPHVYYNNGDMTCTHFHYVIENGLGAVPSYPGIMRSMSLGSAPMPITHLSLDCMFLVSGTLQGWARAWVSEIRYLRLNAPLSRLTTCVTNFVPASVRTLVLVVNHDLSLETNPHPAEVASWERLNTLLLGIKHAKGEHGSQLERVQFVQSALAERIRSELTAHENLKQELIDVGVAIVDERNEPL